MNAAIRGMRPTHPLSNSAGVSSNRITLGGARAGRREYADVRRHLIADLRISRHDIRPGIGVRKTTRYVNGVLRNLGRLWRDVRVCTCV
jgi:hypothetical protein